MIARPFREVREYYFTAHLDSPVVKTISLLNALMMVPGVRLLATAEVTLSHLKTYSLQAKEGEKVKKDPSIH